MCTGTASMLCIDDQLHIFREGTEKPLIAMDVNSASVVGADGTLRYLITRHYTYFRNTTMNQKLRNIIVKLCVASVCNRPGSQNRTPEQEISQGGRARHFEVL